MNFYMIFYKDKDGFDVPLTEYGSAKVHSHIGAADLDMKSIKGEITNLLAPIVKYKYVRTGFFKKELQKMETPKLQDWRVDELKRQYSTMFVKKVKLV